MKHSTGARDDPAILTILNTLEQPRSLTYKQTHYKHLRRAKHSTYRPFPSQRQSEIQRCFW